MKFKRLTSLVMSLAILATSAIMPFQSVSADGLEPFTQKDGVLNDITGIDNELIMPGTVGAKDPVKELGISATPSIFPLVKGSTITYTSNEPLALIKVTEDGTVVKTGNSPLVYTVTKSATVKAQASYNGATSKETSIVLTDIEPEPAKFTGLKFKDDSSWATVECTKAVVMRVSATQVVNDVSDTSVPVAYTLDQASIDAGLRIDVEGTVATLKGAFKDEIGFNVDRIYNVTITAKTANYMADKTIRFTVSPTTDIPMTDLGPSTPVVPVKPADKTVPLTDLEPSTPAKFTGIKFEKGLSEYHITLGTTFITNVNAKLYENDVVNTSASVKYTLSDQAKADGLSIDSDTGGLKGLLNSAPSTCVNGTYFVTVTAESGLYKAEKILTLIIKEKPIESLIISVDVPEGEVPVGTVVNFTTQVATGVVYVISINGVETLNITNKADCNFTIVQDTDVVIRAKTIDNSAVAGSRFKYTVPKTPTDPTGTTVPIIALHPSTPIVKPTDSTGKTTPIIDLKPSTPTKPVGPTNPISPNKPTITYTAPSTPSEPVIIKSHTDIGIEIKGLGELPMAHGTELKVKPTHKTPIKCSGYVKTKGVNNNSKVEAVYYMDLILNNSVVDYKGDVLVTMKAPKNVKDIQILSIDKTDIATLIYFSEKDNNISFRLPADCGFAVLSSSVSNLKPIAIVKPTTVPKTGDSTNTLPVAMLITAGLGLLFMSKKLKED